MSEMVERAARVLARLQAQELDWRERGGVDEERWTEEVWPMFIPNARAVLEAIREPTGAMAGAIYDNCTVWECFRVDGEGRDAERVYTAMIDAALQEAP